VPIGVACIIAIFLCMPSDFPYQGQSNSEHSSQHVYQSMGALFSKNTVKRVDFLGAGLLLIATTFIVAALEQAGHDYAWNSAFVITLMTISGIVWILFTLWERTASLTSKTREPVFPWRLMSNRIWIGMILYVSMFPCL
jgi:hypothetical protein